MYMKHRWILFDYLSVMKFARKNNKKHIWEKRGKNQWFYFLNSTFLYAKCPLAWAQILLSITLSEKTVKKSKFSREKKTFFHAVLLFFMALITRIFGLDTP